MANGLLNHGEKNSQILIGRCPNGTIRGNRSAVSHKLARASYYVLRDQAVFDEKRLFG